MGRHHTDSKLSSELIQGSFSCKSGMLPSAPLWHVIVQTLMKYFILVENSLSGEQISIIKLRQIKSWIKMWVTWWCNRSFQCLIAPVVRIYSWAQEAQSFAPFKLPMCMCIYVGYTGMDCPDCIPFHTPTERKNTDERMFIKAKKRSTNANA